jgi:IclR family mhp operon transcriptional activator
MPEPEKSQMIARALAVLRALNLHNGSKVSQLHAVTGISRPALYRFLTALRDAGYVSRDERGNFHLTHLVRLLSDGFKEEDWIVEHAAVALRELQRTVLWPTTLGVFRNHAIYLRETTRRFSPLVIDQGELGVRLAMLKTSQGLAYLAFCPAEEREEILAALARSNSPDDDLARDRKKVDALIRKTRRDGYGSRYRGVVADTGTIATPVFSGKRVVACIGITFFASVLTPRDAAQRYLDDLKRAARSIESAERYSRNSMASRLKRSARST